MCQACLNYRIFLVEKQAFIGLMIIKGEWYTKQIKPYYTQIFKKLWYLYL